MEARKLGRVVGVDVYRVGIVPVVARLAAVVVLIPVAYGGGGHWLGCGDWARRGGSGSGASGSGSTPSTSRLPIGRGGFLELALRRQRSGSGRFESSQDASELRTQSRQVAVSKALGRAEDIVLKTTA